MADTAELELEEALSTLRDIRAVRYLAVAGAGLIAYEVFLTLSAEFSALWEPLWFHAHGKRRRRQVNETVSSINQVRIARAALFIMRYIPIIMTILYLLIVLPQSTLSDDQCKGLTMGTFFLNVSMEGLGTVVIALRLFKLWDLPLKTTLPFATLFAAMLLSAMGIGYAGVVIEELHVKFQVSPFNVCGTNSNEAPWMISAYIIILVMDSLAFGLFLLYTFSKPRRESQRLIEVMYTDGLPFFLVSFCTRSLSIYFMSLGRASIFYAGYVISAQLISIASCRSLFNLLDVRDPEVALNPIWTEGPLYEQYGLKTLAKTYNDEVRKR